MLVNLPNVKRTTGVVSFGHVITTELSLANTGVSKSRSAKLASRKGFERFINVSLCSTTGRLRQSAKSPRDSREGPCLLLPFPLPTSHFPLPTSHFPLPTSHFPLVFYVPHQLFHFPFRFGRQSQQRQAHR